MPPLIWAERDDTLSVTTGAQGVLLPMTISFEGTKTVQQHFRWSYSYLYVLEALHTAQLQTFRRENCKYTTCQCTHTAWGCAGY